MGDLCTFKTCFLVWTATRYWNLHNHLDIFKRVQTRWHLESDAPSNLFLCRWTRCRFCTNLIVSQTSFKNRCANSWRLIWMSMCVCAVVGRTCGEYWWKLKKEPWRKPICYLYQTALHELPLTVMHCKRDWFEWYREIVRLNCLLLPYWWNYCTLVFESIMAD